MDLYTTQIQQIAAEIIRVIHQKGFGGNIDDISIAPNSLCHALYFEEQVDLELKGGNILNIFKEEGSIIVSFIHPNGTLETERIPIYYEQDVVKAYYAKRPDGTLISLPLCGEKFCSCGHYHQKGACTTPKCPCRSNSAFNSDGWNQFYKGL